MTQLYQRVRPTSFDGMVGNTSSVSELRAMLKKPINERTHCFLFHGPTGTGKTTLARILVEEIGTDPLHVTEYNAANTRGIDTVREFCRSVVPRPWKGNTKFFIFDESHQLTKTAQEGMLKTLEDFPEHAYFALCTTDKSSLIPALMGRLTKYPTYRLDQEEMIMLLLNVCEKEQVDVPDEILYAIMEASDGIPREALVYLEKAFSFIGADGKCSEILFEKLKREIDQKDAAFKLVDFLSFAPEIRKKRWNEGIRRCLAIEGDAEATRMLILSLFLKKMVSCESHGADSDEVQDLASIIRIFNRSVFYGGKHALGALVVDAVFGKGE